MSASGIRCPVRPAPSRRKRLARGTCEEDIDIRREIAISLRNVVIHDDFAEVDVATVGCLHEFAFPCVLLRYKNQDSIHTKQHERKKIRTVAGAVRAHSNAVARFGIRLVARSILVLGSACSFDHSVREINIGRFAVVGGRLRSLGLLLVVSHGLVFLVFLGLLGMFGLRGLLVLLGLLGLRGLLVLLGSFACRICLVVRPFFLFSRLLSV